MLIVREDDNVHNHDMLNEIAGWIFNDLDRAVAQVRELIAASRTEEAPGETEQGAGGIANSSPGSNDAGPAEARVRMPQFVLRFPRSALECEVRHDAGVLYKPAVADQSILVLRPAPSSGQLSRLRFSMLVLLRARYRGGERSRARPSCRLTPGRSSEFSKGAMRSSDSHQTGLIGKFLRRRAPIHFGGMSDPFHPVEQTFRVTRSFLETLVRFQHPTVLSTRSTMPGSEPYLGLLRQMKSVVVQFSFSSTRREISGRLEPHTPEPAELLKTMERLSRHGIPVTCRWQPYVPRVSERPRAFVKAVVAAGARHVAIEHLKLPVETNHPLWSKLQNGAGRDLHRDYASAGARRDGRELVLPPAVKLPAIMEVKAAAREAARLIRHADNEFQYLSDSDCCCSGVDQFPGFEGWFKHQIAHAVRRCYGKRIVYGAVSGFWTPEGSVDRWLNSRSRLGAAGANAGTIRDHIRDRWNDPHCGFSPASYFGVAPSGELSSSGFRIYDWQPEAFALRVRRTDRPLPRRRPVKPLVANIVEIISQPFVMHRSEVQLIEARGSQQAIQKCQDDLM